MALIPDVELDFSRYVALRRGLAEARARDGAAYAYSGEDRVRRTLAMARPVTLAIEATVRMWQTVKRSELLGSSVKVTDQQFPRLHGGSLQGRVCRTASLRGRRSVHLARGLAPRTSGVVLQHLRRKRFASENFVFTAVRF